MHRLRRAFLSLISCVSLMIGCHSHSDAVTAGLIAAGRSIVAVRVYIADEFSVTEKNNIIAGITMWERATGGMIVWYVMPSDAPLARGLGRLSDGSEDRVVLFIRSESTVNWVKDWDVAHPGRSLLGMCEGDSLNDISSIWLVEDRLKSKIGRAHV